jgi:hypothetical protein
VSRLSNPLLLVRPSSSDDQLAPIPVFDQAPDLDSLLSRFLGELQAGKFDDRLEDIWPQVRDRVLTARELRARQALDAFRLHDEVVFAAHVKPAYLRGMAGRIVEINEGSIVVCVHRALGRFHDGHIQCTPLSVLRLNRSTAT